MLLKKQTIKQMNKQNNQQHSSTPDKSCKSFLK